MNYQIFDEMKEGRYMQQPGETEQAYMERILRAVAEPCPDKREMNFNDMIAPEFCECSVKEKTLRLRFRPQSWQQNPNGVLHGGIIATAMDMTLGMLTRYYVRDSKAVTVQLSVSFLRGIPMDHSFSVTAKADKAGRNIRFMSAEIIDEATGKIAAEAASVFM